MDADPAVKAASVNPAAADVAVSAAVRLSQGGRGGGHEDGRERDGR
ncbi:MAG: hypothetical protein WDM92_07650 [Caulobacteraceae bacterium]